MKKVQFSNSEPIGTIGEVFGDKLQAALQQIEEVVYENDRCIVTHRPANKIWPYKILSKKTNKSNLYSDDLWKKTVNRYYGGDVK